MIGTACRLYSAPNSLQEADIRRRWVGVIALAVALSSCGDNDALAPDPSLAPFVGDWRAASLVVASPVAPDLSVDLIELGSSFDLIELGSSFDLNIQPSGHYTAILVFAGQGQTEIGQISLSGPSAVILDREFPLPREISRPSCSTALIA